MAWSELALRDDACEVEEGFLASLSPTRVTRSPQQEFLSSAYEGWIRRRHAGSAGDHPSPTVTPAHRRYEQTEGQEAPLVSWDASMLQADFSTQVAVEAAYIIASSAAERVVEEARGRHERENSDRATRRLRLDGFSLRSKAFGASLAEG